MPPNESIFEIRPRIQPAHRKAAGLRLRLPEGNIQQKMRGEEIPATPASNLPSALMRGRDRQKTPIHSGADIRTRPPDCQYFGPI
jgi:hypothetical protein